MVAVFIRGGIFMWPILILLVWGIMICIERSYTFTKSSRSTRKFIPKLMEALKENGVEEAKKICKQTSGPVAEIFAAGLEKADKGLMAVEKAIESTGTIEMAFLEKGMIWLSTVVAVAPMFGFAGTVSGMIHAFDAIAKVNDISPAIVASGIAEALLTTIFGLSVAMPMQIIYNVFISRIDAITIDMEEYSVNFLETMATIDLTKK